jgi:hypothetical protein
MEKNTLNCVVFYSFAAMGQKNKINKDLWLSFVSNVFLSVIQKDMTQVFSKDGLSFQLKNLLHRFYSNWLEYLQDL